MALFFLYSGQRQPLSFVRALLADPCVLMLDEAIASIDAETELLVQTGLATLLRGRTAFIIAHRLSTVKHPDRIIVLDQAAWPRAARMKNSSRSAVSTIGCMR